MCFSATASFISGGVLTTIAVVSIIKTQSRSQLMLACIPLVFAMQQFSEGFVWIGLTDPVNLPMQTLATNLFLLFALVVWPAWVPAAFYLVEKSPKHKKILAIISVIGFVFAILSTYYLLNYNSTASITPYHIHYELNVPYGSQTIFGIVYLVPTVLSHFVSTIKRVRLLGYLIITSYAITRLFFEDEVISVWCFFSALISIVIYLVLVEINKVPTKVNG